MIKSTGWSVSASIMFTLSYHIRSYGDESMDDNKSDSLEIVDFLHQYIWSVNPIKEGRMHYPSARTMITLLVAFVSLQLIFMALAKFFFVAVMEGSVAKLNRWIYMSLVVYFTKLLFLFFWGYFMGYPSVGMFLYLIFAFIYETMEMIQARKFRDRLMGREAVDLLRCNNYYLYGLL